MKTESDLMLRWGNRKGLRCTKIHTKAVDHQRATIKNTYQNRVATNSNACFNLRPRLSSPANFSAAPTINGGFNLRERVPSSPPPPTPPPQRLRRNLESMRCSQSNGTAVIDGESKDIEGCSSGGSEAAAAVIWPPKLAIGLTNKEKEEDFMTIKGSKLPNRPKKRAKFVQRTLNLVSPGAWLCDLTLDRYEVREKKISRKKARGLKALNNMDSGSE